MKRWSRQRKVAFCLVILFVSLFISLSMSEWPSPTLEIAIRRMEKRMLIGPMDIIATLDFEYSHWDHLVIGKSEYGYSIYDYGDDLGWDRGGLDYFPKEENATLFCTEYPYRTAHNESFLPIFLFPEKQNSAEADMELRITIDGETKTCQMDGVRKDNSFYLFSLPMEGIEGEYFWILQQALTGAYSEYVLAGTVEISIDFYDVSGNLIDTYTKSVSK